MENFYVAIICIAIALGTAHGNVTANKGNGIDADTCKNNKSYKSFSETGSCYHFHDIGATWSEAKALCEMEGAKLVTLDNQLEANIIAGLYPSDLVRVASTSVARVGLRQINYRNWQWNDGSTLTSKFANWQPGEPNNDRENLCAALATNGQLDDIQCNNEVAFICEARIKN